MRKKIYSFEAKLTPASVWGQRERWLIDGRVRKQVIGNLD